MVDTSLGEAIPVGNFPELKKEVAGTPTQEIPEPTSTETPDFMTAAWQLAFMPMIMWSTILSSSLTVLEQSISAQRLM